MRKIIPKDWVSAYFEFGVDKDNRRIFLDGEIHAESAQYIRRSILYLDSLSSEKPIELWICSEGGDEYCALSIYDTLSTIKCPVHTIATGMCMSVAPLLVAAGKVGERYATPHSWFMVHQSWSEEIPSRVDEQKKAIEHAYEVGKQWYTLMAKHTKTSAIQWRRMCEKVGNTYFNAEEALEFGLVDQLWSEK